MNCLASSLSKRELRKNQKKKIEKVFFLSAGIHLQFKA